MQFILALGVFHRHDRVFHTDQIVLLQLAQGQPDLFRLELIVVTNDNQCAQKISQASL